MLAYLCFPASFGSIVPECSHTLKITSWICHLKYKYEKKFLSAMSVVVCGPSGLDCIYTMISVCVCVCMILNDDLTAKRRLCSHSR